MLLGLNDVRGTLSKSNNFGLIVLDGSFFKGFRFGPRVHLYGSIVDLIELIDCLYDMRAFLHI